jgi:hypothetical protein
VEVKRGESQLDKAIIGVLLIAIIAIVSVTSLAYFVAVQPDQTLNTPSPTPTPTPTPKPTTIPTPTPSEKPAEPATIPKPSVPEFTLRWQVYLDYAPFMYVTIKNQPFTPYNDTDGNLIRLYYDIRVKEHSGDDWEYLTEYLRAWDSENTTQVYSVSTYESDDPGIRIVQEVYDGGEVDLQVRALIGYFQPTWVDYGPLWGFGYYEVFTGVTSDWSKIQTIPNEEVQIPISQEP